MIRFYDFRAVRCFSVLHNETPTEVVCLMAVGGFINSAFKIRLEILAFLYFLGIQNASLIVCPVCIAKNITTVSLYCFAIGFSSVRDVWELCIQVHYAEAFSRQRFSPWVKCLRHASIREVTIS